ncbi:type II secretion system F family protein [Aeoliella mucimassa]|uniref:Type II secretion system protein F n=1 Tax=Aeoliella mucimassa TaxID=2527972 RepID=A0A518AJ73_9BACT|nr:type II secretion system F family protein [Aeoliella mucimassa]QDU54773.1 Type II secretion system protein F [Aeoliella mucimassa]
MQINAAKSFAEVAPSGRMSAPAPVKKVRGRTSALDVVNLTSQMAIMLRSGVDIASALDSVATHCKRPQLRVILEEIHDAVMGGRSFSEALRKYPKVFTPAYVATIAAGEASGHMADVLDQLAELERSRLRLVRSIRGMLVYPVLLGLVSLGVITLLLIFVLPRFSKLFDDYDMSLPWLTQALIAISDELRGHWWLWCPVIGLAILGLISVPTTTTGRRLWDRFLLSTPMLNEVTRSILVGRSCRLMAMLMESGVPLLDSVQLARQSSRNTLYQELFTRVEDAVVNGRSFASELIGSFIVPDSAAEMLSTAEQSGKLTEVTRLVGMYFEEEGENRARQAVTSLEPMITVVMGLIVAIVVLAVMLPVFDLSTFAGKS